MAARRRTAAYGDDLCPPHCRLDRTDLLDEDYIVESATIRGGVLGLDGDTFDRVPPLSREKERERAAAALQASAPLPSLTSLGARHQACLTSDDAADFTPLDEAVVRMVERGKSTEVKRRMYGSILLLGGVSRTPGLAAYLEWCARPPASRRPKPKAQSPEPCQGAREPASGERGRVGGGQGSCLDRAGSGRGAEEPSSSPLPRC